MATDVKLPRLGQGMESGTIVKWLKAEGDPVEKGDPLYELDTDKVTQEVEAEASGVLLQIAVEGGEVEVGRTIGVIGEEGEQVAAPSPETPPAPEGAAPSAGTGPAPEGTAQESADGAAESAEKPAEAPAREPERERGRRASADPDAVQSGPSAPADGSRVKASPLARRIARERGIELTTITGTGPEGRVVAEDVERAGTPSPAATSAPASAAPAAGPEASRDVGEVEVQPLSSVRRTIVRRLSEAWQAPAFQVTMTADMTRALALRARLLELVEEGGVRPTVSDVLTKVCAVALMRHRAVNAHFAGDAIHLFPSANIGIAVAIPGGLVVPVIPGCERLTVAETAAARAAVVERAHAGKLQAADVAGGTFTISNLGMYGVERFVAVLNPPQAAILAVGAAEERAVVRKGELVAEPTIELTLTCDHRSLDGATAAEFLRTVKTFLEEPGLAL